MSVKKLSVIIPTIYKKPLVLFKLIEMLDKEDVVDEIILISNAACSMSFPYTKKLKVFEPESNVYVYMSWNFGISIMQNDNFLLLNDDILFCPGFCEKVLNSEVFDDRKTGLIGLSEKALKLYDKKSVDDIEIPKKEDNAELFFEPLEKYMEIGDYASALFGRKENYYQVPDCFNIFYGDNYLLYQNIMRDKINYAVSGFTVNHIHNSSSTSPEFFEIRDKDRWAWAAYTLDYIRQNKF